MPRKFTENCQFHSEKLQVRFEKTIPANVDEIEKTVLELMEIISESDCAKDEAFSIELAVREALANAILHGAKGDSSKTVRICLACEPDRGMLIVVRDPGPGFDPQEIPSPIVGQNILSNHGRGIFLINQLMDEVRFEKGGTEIHMLKRY